MRAFLSWLIDNYLGGLVVLRADYDVVQESMWRAQWHEQQAVAQADAAIKEMLDAMDSAYAQSIPFAHFDSSEIKAEVISYHDYRLRYFCYQTRVHEIEWHSVRDLASFKRNFLERFADNAGRAFQNHVRTQLFKLENL